MIVVSDSTPLIHIAKVERPDMIGEAMKKLSLNE